MLSQERHSIMAVPLLPVCGITTVTAYQQLVSDTHDVTSYINVRTFLRYHSPYINKCNKSTNVLKRAAELFKVFNFGDCAYKAELSQKKLQQKFLYHQLYVCTICTFHENSVIFLSNLLKYFPTCGIIKPYKFLGGISHVS